MNLSRSGGKGAPSTNVRGRPGLIFRNTGVECRAMKWFILFAEKHFIFKLLSIVAGVWVCFLLLSAPAYSGAGEGDELVTLDVHEMPLSGVLEELSKATGYEFTVAEAWLDFPISVSFDSIPLHRALKRMLADLNSTVLYGSHKKIKIIIYDDASEAPATSKKQKTKNPAKKKKSRQRNAK